MSTLPLTASAGGMPSLSLPSDIAHSVWRAGQMAAAGVSVTSSGWPALDKELPNQAGRTVD
jgi:hypothetical protein